MGGLVSTRKSFFLSHAGPNKGVALCLARLLHTHRLGYWLDVLDLESAPRDGIYRAIEQAQCFVIVASGEYGRRGWCMQEKGYAEGLRKDILCLRIERPPDSASSARSVQGEASPLRVYFEGIAGTNTRGLSGVSVSDEINELFSKFLHINLTDREREELDSWLDYFDSVDVSRLEYDTMKSFVKDGSLPGDIGSDYEQLSDVDDDETAGLLHESSSLQPGDNSGEKSSWESISVGLLAGVVLVLLACVVARMLVNECRQLCQIHIGFDGSEALGANGFGVVYRDLDGAEKHPFQIFADHDYKWGRVRVMVNPDGRYGLFQDTEYVAKTVASLKKDHGMKVLLDFHYSSWHANQVNQWIPPDWRATDDATELRALVCNHTKEVIWSLWNQRTLPDAIQIGNEITNGMLWPTFRLNVTDDNDSHWSALADLTSTARNALHDVLKDKVSKDEMPKIVIHLATGGDANETLYWLRRFTAADCSHGHCSCSDCIFGLSYYPMWMAGGLDQLQATLRGLEESFPTNDVWIVETGFFWENNTDSHQVPVEFENSRFENSPEGQFKFLVALRSVMEEHSRRSGRDTAIFYTGSHCTQQELWMKVNETWDLSQRSLFNDDAIALPAIDALLPRMGSLRDICSKTMW